MTTDKLKIQHLERKIIKQAHRIAQLEAIVKEIRFLIKSKEQEASYDMSEIANNIIDDTCIDRLNGEFGARSEKEAIKLVRRYSLSLVKRKQRKWEKMAEK